uniref:Putative short d7 salivary protein n=1 Tax=Psorophora albipes TaxID=869069 RepID=T1DIZ0_9DIPT
MNLILSIFYCCLFSCLLMVEAESVFAKCAEQYYNTSTDKEILCKITKLAVDANMLKMVDFMNCGLKNLGYYNEGKKEMNVNNVLEGMTELGYSKEQEVKDVIGECKTEFGANITALDYLSCLLIDDKTRREFKMLIMTKEADFLKQNFCS